MSITEELVPTNYLRVRDGILEQWYSTMSNALGCWPPEKHHKGQWRPLGRVMPIEVKKSDQSPYDPDL